MFVEVDKKQKLHKTAKLIVTTVSGEVWKWMVSGQSQFTGDTNKIKKKICVKCGNYGAWEKMLCCYWSGFNFGVYDFDLTCSTNGLNENLIDCKYSNITKTIKFSRKARHSK